MMLSKEVLWAFVLCVAYVPGVPPAAEIGRWAILIMGAGFFQPKWEWRSLLLVMAGLWWLIGVVMWAPNEGVGLGEWLKVVVS